MTEATFRHVLTLLERLDEIAAQLDRIEQGPVAYAKALRPGDVILLRLTHHLTADGERLLWDQTKEGGDRAGVKFILLGPELEVIEREGET